MTLADLDTSAALLLAWLATYAVHSTIMLAAAALVAWRFADHHAWLDVVWKTALVAPLVTASLNLESFALPLGGQWTVPGVVRPEVTQLAAPQTEAQASQPSRAVDRATERPESNRASSANAATRLSPQTTNVQWPLVAVVAWLILATVLVVRYVVRLRRVYWSLATGVPPTTDLVATVEALRLSANLRRTIRLTSSPCPVPLALAGRHIVVPQRFLQELDPDEQRAALAHEMAHIARRDPEWRIAMEILERALCVQPLNRLARARLSDSAEFLCDEWAVQQTQSPLAMARCLSVVGSWWSPADELPAGVSAMARSDSAMVRRVTRILDEPQPASRRRRALWLLVPVAAIAVAAPRVTATQLPSPAAVASTAAAVLALPKTEMPTEQRQAQRIWTDADVAAARSRLRDYRSRGDTLDQRWQQALADAGRQGLTDFWIVYTFTTPTHAGDVVFSDTRDGGATISSDGRFWTGGPPLNAVLDFSAVPLEGGPVAVAMHHRSGRADAIDRAAYLSVQLGLDFGRAPVFWLGGVAESESFARVQNLFGQTRTEKLQVLLIELASLHSDTNVVAPFLSRLVQAPWPPAIRSEAAEGFEHHHHPRSVEILLRVARTDPDSSVRSEAAETIGEVQTPQSIAALTELTRESDDPEVRREAAEGFADQPAAQALPALESVIATSGDEDVLEEAVEALGDLGDPAALPILVQIASAHANARAQQEAVETIGDLDVAGAVDALTKIAWEHPNATIRDEAVETLGDRKDDAGAVAAVERIMREHPDEQTLVEAIGTFAEMSAEAIPAQILALAESGRSPLIRREAIEEIADALDEIVDARALDRAEQMLERVIYDDPDASVRMEALDALDELPGDRAGRALRKIADGHPDARVRREAAEHLRKE